MTDLPDPLPEFPVHAHAWTVYHWIHEAGTDEDPCILDAPYQRGSVWDVERRRNLIRSLIIGIPVGSIIYSTVDPGLVPERPHAVYRIIDGKQRIEAVRAFAADEFGIPGWWFNPDDVGDELRRKDELFYSEIPQGARFALVNNSALPGGEFTSDRAAVKNPDYDPSIEFRTAKRDDPRIHRYNWITFTNEEALAREAEVFLLINFGGVKQTDEHRSRVEGMVG